MEVNPTSFSRLPYLQQMASPSEYISIMSQDPKFLDFHDQLPRCFISSKQNVNNPGYTEETNRDANGPVDAG
jgi:hypothetical protein